MGLQGIGFTEILILLVVVLLLFGAKRIPEIAGRSARASPSSSAT
jgi:sec-independent protein translocase protein TatA